MIELSVAAEVAKVSFTRWELGFLLGAALLVGAWVGMCFQAFLVNTRDRGGDQ